MIADEAKETAGSPLTPCVRNCCLDDEDICLGCHRALAEILAWGNASDAEKRDVLGRCRLRRERRRQQWPDRF